MTERPARAAKQYPPAAGSNRGRLTIIIIIIIIIINRFVRRAMSDRGKRI